MATPSTAKVTPRIVGAGDPVAVAVAASAAVAPETVAPAVGAVTFTVTVAGGGVVSGPLMLTSSISSHPVRARRWKTRNDVAPAGAVKAPVTFVHVVAAAGSRSHW